MRSFAIITLVATLSGCATVDEWLVKPSVTLDDGTVVEGESKAEAIVDKYDDQALLVTPIQYKWAVPVIGALVAIASTVATRVRPGRRKEEEASDELAEETNPEVSND